MVLHTLELGGKTYNIPYSIRSTGKFHFRIFEKSINEIVARHESLRTKFVNVNGKPVQMILQDVKISIPFIDLEELPHSEKEKQLMKL